MADRVVVIDNGTDTIKAGFSGDASPRVLIPTAVGGKRPIARGVIHDWEGVEHLWRAAFDALGVAPERLQKELTALAADGDAFNVIAPEGRSFSAWRGGSLRAASAAYQQAAV